MNSFRVTACMCLGLAAGGCGTTVHVPQWQRTVEAYVRTAAHGDLSALRDVQDSEGRPAITATHGQDIHRSTDVTGLLLGMAIIDEYPHYIFLVAEVERGKVDLMKIASLKSVGGEMRWHIGKPSPEALAAYRGAHARLALPLWPYPEDVFDLHVDGRTIAVTERHSGARWTLQIPPARTASQAEASPDTSGSPG